MSTRLTQGRRIFVNEEGYLILEKPGDYGRDKEGKWWARVPLIGYSMGSLGNHEVFENADGTITVTPSILMNGNGDKPAWHGYLTDGVWHNV